MRIFGITNNVEVHDVDVPGCNEITILPDYSNPLTRDTMSNL